MRRSRVPFARAKGTSLAFAFALSLSLANAAFALDWPDTADRVERGLLSKDPVKRRESARALEALGPTRATSLILQAMGDPDVDVRLAAARSAVRRHVVAATGLALLWLGERDARLRSSACDVAGAMPESKAVPALARALGDVDPGVRGACVDALGAQASPDAVAPLAGKLDDPAPALRARVARALAKLGDARAVVPLLGKVQDSVPEVRQAVVRALGDLGDSRASPTLLLALRDSVAEVQIETLGALGRLRANEATSSIAPLALERNPNVKQAALVALGRIASPDAVRALVKALSAQEQSAPLLERTPAREALVAAGEPAAIELMALLERGVSPSLATSAAWVLGELHEKKSAHVVVRALRAGMISPAAALHALSGAGTSEQLPVALEFISDANAAVRDEARAAASALLDPTTPDGRAVEPLVARLRASSTRPAERAALVKLLGQTGAVRAAVELAGWVSAKDSSVRLAAIDALGTLGPVASGRDVRAPASESDSALVTCLRDVDPTVRLHAAVALALSGGVLARGQLLGAIDAGEEIDRYAVLTALGGILERFPDETVTTRLFKELEIAAGPERDALLEAVGRAQLPSVRQALAKLAIQGDVDDRRTIAAVLGAHRGSTEVIALASTLTRDVDASVRAQAAFTLGSIGDSSVVAALVALSNTADANVATSAAGGLARFGAGSEAHAAVTSAACSMLSHGRANVRANALVALSLTHGRCLDPAVMRRLLAEDPSSRVRAAAARALASSSLREDRDALDRCVSSDHSEDVARVCRMRTERAETTSRSVRARPRAVTVFVCTDPGASAAPTPHAPFLLEYEGGILHAGVTDRRGATFEPSAPAGEVSLRRPLSD